MKYLKKINEVSVYHNLNGYDKHEITILKRDNIHKYEYCDGILYELYSKDDYIVSVDDIVHTDENLFYEDQIERYIQYFQSGGGTQSFPIVETNYKDCYNLEEMLYYLEDDIDLRVDILAINHSYLYDKDFGELIEECDEYGFESEVRKNGKLYSPLDSITNIKELNSYYDIDEDISKKEVYNGFKAILEYWSENKQYNLTDLNHRFAALVRLGKKEVYIDPS